MRLIKVNQVGEEVWVRADEIVSIRKGPGGCYIDFRTMRSMKVDRPPEDIAAELAQKEGI